MLQLGDQCPSHDRRKGSDLPGGHLDDLSCLIDNIFLFVSWGDAKGTTQQLGDLTIAGVARIQGQHELPIGGPVPWGWGDGLTDPLGLAVRLAILFHHHALTTDLEGKNNLVTGLSKFLTVLNTQAHNSHQSGWVDTSRDRFYRGLHSLSPRYFKPAFWKL